MESSEESCPSITLLVFQSLVFIAIWVPLNRFVTLRGPIPGARRVTRLNSILYSLANIPLLVLILSPSHDALARHLCHASKIYEYLDVLNMYAYFGAWTAARTALPWTGSAQLVAGILVEGRLLWQKVRGATGAMWPNAVALYLGLLYLALWARDLRIRTRAERNEEKDL
ncbi:hypothetical protein NKR23_g9491 [Pleurostoma richardsiae]|uniref:Uncharacterized protein n=1 Tax=Pleurostoma richardsiae TaxID=41990 RepID=A0AA38VC71_9PEZI|nr:hypothetical protein NKR23_g9491 [Pleurostoma richardsiae]